jgi:hypothetical protein
MDAGYLGNPTSTPNVLTPNTLLMYDTFDEKFIGDIVMNLSSFFYGIKIPPNRFLANP